MRRAAWFCLFLFAIAFDALAQQPIGPPSRQIPSGQTGMLLRYELLTLTGRETFEAQLSLTRRGPFTGTMGGDPIRGALAVDGAVTRLAFVRLRNGAPWRAYVGASGGTAGARFSGIAYALSTNAGATDARNAWSFIAAPQANRFQTCLPGRVCPGVTRPADPANAARPYPRGLVDHGTWPSGGLNPAITHAIQLGAGPQPAETGRLDLTLVANGDATGTAFSDAVVGHYATGAGTLALVRMRSGRPHQMLVVTLERDQRISGRAYALTAGAFDQPWMGPEPIVGGLQSASSGDCMVAAEGAAQISLRNCNPTTTPEERWALVHVGSWRLLSVEDALCFPESLPNAPITLAPCNNDLIQTMYVDGAFPAAEGMRIVEGLAPQESTSRPHVGGFSLLRFRWVSDRCVGIPPQNAPDQSAITRSCEETYEEKVWWGKRT